MPVIVPIRVRRDTTANWESVNPVLSLAEPGLDITKNTLKFGDGSSNWNTLQNFNTPRSSTITVAPSDSKYKNLADIICDGVNDQIDIQQAMEELPSTGGKVFCLDGTFNINANIIPLDYVHLQGMGMYQTIFKGTSTCADSVFRRYGSSTPASTVDNPITGLVFQDFCIDGSIMPLDGPEGGTGGEYGGGKGTYFSYLKNCIFERVYVYNTPASGFGNDFHDNCVYHACIVKNAGRGQAVGNGEGGSPGCHGFGIGSGAYSSERLVISDCLAEGCWFGGFAFEAVSPTTYANYSEFHNCISANNRDGFVFFSAITNGVAKAKVIGGSCYGNTNHGIYMHNAPQEITVSDMNITNNSLHGIYIDRPESANINIHDCHINNNSRNGIYSVCSCLKIHDNFIYSNGYGGIFQRADIGSASNIDISSNQVYNNGTAGVSGENDGIRISPTTTPYTISQFSIIGNRCWDDQSTKTQRYGICITGGSYISNGGIYNNFLVGNLTSALYNAGSGGNIYLKNNQGYLTEVFGSATITAGDTFTTVNHGLVAAPTRVLITPTTSTGSKQYYISAKTSSTFTITIDSSSTSDISFDWQAII